MKDMIVVWIAFCIVHSDIALTCDVDAYCYLLLLFYYSNDGWPAKSMGKREIWPVDLKPLKILSQKLDTLIALRGATRVPNFMVIGLGVSAPRIAKYNVLWLCVPSFPFPSLSFPLIFSCRRIQQKRMDVSHWSRRHTTRFQPRMTQWQRHLTHNNSACVRDISEILSSNKWFSRSSYRMRQRNF